MYIKAVEIDGFKSYGVKTEIKGFDPLFNAITGLNGSGKSNILDAICFVLGITNLSQVRVSNLQELVYKSGQAGVTKAAVSIVFDNSDSSGAPVGYENAKEITVTRVVIIGGRNKYFINGSAANAQRVQDFFQSMQLNVNNPHFLIMQGRITKVLNMKPLEILSMVEEAAGTRMYESKKENSLKHMKKKEDRLKEIDSVLNEEIMPTLARLKEERRDFVEYQKICREVTLLEKLHIAWTYVQAQEASTRSSEDAKRIEEELKTNDSKVSDLKRKITEVDGHIADLEKKRDEESGGKLRQMETDLKEKQMAETKVNNTLQNLKSQLKDDSKKKVELNKQFIDEKNLLLKKEREVEKLQKKVEGLKETCDKDAKAEGAAVKKLQDINAGLYSSEDGESASLAAQIMHVEEEISKTKTEEKLAQGKLPHLKKELAKKQSECKGADGNYKKNEAQIKALEVETENMRKQLNQLHFVEGEYSAMETKTNLSKRRMNEYRQALDDLYARCPNLLFEYTDPIKNFDRRKVHGFLCKLIKLKDPNTALALEVAAGGKLFNVVVDDDQTGKLLLSKGQLRQRITLIPLNKITSRPITNDVAHQAESLVGKKNVCTALALIDYDKKLKSGMEYAFGDAFICPSMEPAKKVTFAPHISRKSVTYDGEVFSPAGTLSGGSMKNRDHVLLELCKINKVEADLEREQKQFQESLKFLESSKHEAEKYRRLKDSYEYKSDELKHLKVQLEGSNFHQQQQEVEDVKKSIENQTAIATKCKETLKTLEKRLKELKDKANNAKSSREQEIKNANQAVEACQKRLTVSEKAYKDVQQEVDQIKLEIVDIKNSITNYEQQVETLVNVVEELDAKRAEIETDLKQRRDEVAKFSDSVKFQKATLKAQNAEIAKLHKEKEAMGKEVDNTRLHMQQLEHDVAKSTSDSKDAAKNVEQIVAKFHWIEEDKKYFGVPNTEYDFSKYDMRTSGSKLKKLDEAKATLAKSVNHRAHSMLQNVEEQYKDLVGKKKVVIKDRDQIKNVINTLDEQKKVSLKNACTKVNRDFGSIFSTLLPGAKAKLVPQQGCDVLEGLEFKVGFGDVWKESLTELSGGQRSLVALSLILSLLLFKPAPIYILDEIDAALDLSHTQNIGLMLKKHFQKSQFIIVSLKNGMFANANVLFKTKFVDGMSTVTRVAQGRKH